MGLIRQAFRKKIICPSASDYKEIEDYYWIICNQTPGHTCALQQLKEMEEDCLAEGEDLSEIDDMYIDCDAHISSLSKLFLYLNLMLNDSSDEDF